MPFARSNPAVEKWCKYKEDYHLRFRYTPQRIFDSMLWCIIVPFATFKLITVEQVLRPPIPGLPPDALHHRCTLS